MWKPYNPLAIVRLRPGLLHMQCRCAAVVAGAQTRGGMQQQPATDAPAAACAYAACKPCPPTALGIGMVLDRPAPLADAQPSSGTRGLSSGRKLDSPDGLEKARGGEGKRNACMPPYLPVHAHARTRAQSAATARCGSHEDPPWQEACSAV